MAITEVFKPADELGEMTPEEFVGLIREECMKPGMGMYDHPFVQGLEDGSVTINFSNPFTFFRAINSGIKSPWLSGSSSFT